jgi:hypothetical protein
MPDATVLELVDAMDDEVPAAESGLDAPDHRDGRVYVHDWRLRLAVKVALTTGRPLLLRGDPGTGKSSFAAYVARNLGWRYYEHVVTARTQARDLLWTFDALRKLADAHMSRGEQLDDHDYIEPGALWWAIDPDFAARRGRAPGVVPDGSALARDPVPENERRAHDEAVVLIARDRQGRPGRAECASGGPGLEPVRGLGDPHPGPPAAGRAPIKGPLDQPAPGDRHHERGTGAARGIPAALRGPCPGASG